MFPCDLVVQKIPKPKDNPTDTEAVTYGNYVLQRVKLNLARFDDGMIEKAVEVCSKVDTASTVYLALGGTIPQLEMTSKKQPALKLILQLKKALEDL